VWNCYDVVLNMADSDPISESTPKKKRKLDNGSSIEWDSGDDNAEEFTVDDFHTIATLPISTQQQQQQKKLQYTAQQLHSDLSNAHPTNTHTFTTQPTQALSASVLVARSSPTPARTTASPKSPPQRIRRPFSKPSLIASAIAPPGTAFRPPLGVQSRPAAVQIDSDDDDPPPRHHSSDDEGDTQGMRSNLKPTNFLKGGRGLDSTPNRHVVQESPRPRPPPPPVSDFSSLLSEFSYNASNSNSSPKPHSGVNDMASAYGNTRRPKLPTQPMRPPRNAVIYNTIDDIDDYIQRTKVIQIRAVFPDESIQRCMDALLRNKGNVDDSKAWLLEDIDAPRRDTIDLTSSSPVRPAAKQAVTAPVHSIAERYARSQASQPADRSHSRAANGRRRLIQGRKSARSSLSPRS